MNGERSRLAGLRVAQEAVGGNRAPQQEGDEEQARRAGVDQAALLVRRRAARASPRLPSPLYLPSRGTTIFSVTQVPAMAMKKVETTMKYQLQAGLTS